MEPIPTSTQIEFNLETNFCSLIPGTEALSLIPSLPQKGSMEKLGKLPTPISKRLLVHNNTKKRSKFFTARKSDAKVRYLGALLSHSRF